MKTKTVQKSVESFITLYDMHTNFFSKVVDGISDDDSHNRLNTKANHIAWLTGSLVQQRYEVAKALGTEKKQVAHNLFKDGKGIQDGVSYPSLAAFKKDWESITPVLRDALLNVNAEKLDEPFEMGAETMTVYDLITFIIYREANCIGQTALWRRLLGYEAMKYD